MKWIAVCPYGHWIEKPKPTCPICGRTTNIHTVDDDGVIDPKSLDYRLHEVKSESH